MIARIVEWDRDRCPVRKSNSNPAERAESEPVEDERAVAGSFRSGKDADGNCARTEKDDAERSDELREHSLHERVIVCHGQ